MISNLTRRNYGNQWSNGVQETARTVELKKTTCNGCIKKPPQYIKIKAVYGTGHNPAPFCLSNIRYENGLDRLRFLMPLDEDNHATFGLRSGLSHVGALAKECADFV